MLKPADRSCILVVNSGEFHYDFNQQLIIFQHEYTQLSVESLFMYWKTEESEKLQENLDKNNTKWGMEIFMQRRATDSSAYKNKYQHFILDYMTCGTTISIVYASPN